jgi:hypothetical protein
VTEGSANLGPNVVHARDVEQDRNCRSRCWMLAHLPVAQAAGQRLFLDVLTKIILRLQSAEWLGLSAQEVAADEEPTSEALALQTGG